ncbi:hypothetical protein JG687_00015134 [Phytophthora cactorum]|uniref:Uncharacterized protein n=1 Tax=Phytophthora cactorum TaxID=29920 RepID=A0A8T1TZP3_9STRA|nr:hypothetical protein JG687_00015134 [Phytophthora cactorum]
MRGKFVGALTGSHAIKTKIHVWLEDRKRLEQDWRKVSSNVRLIAEETNTLGWQGDDVCHRHRGLANEVIAEFTSSRLRTEFATLSGNELLALRTFWVDFVAVGSMIATSTSAWRHSENRSVVVTCSRR